MKTLKPIAMNKSNYNLLKFSLITCLLLLMVNPFFSNNSDSLVNNTKNSKNITIKYDRNFTVYEIADAAIKKGTQFFTCNERFMVFNNLALQYVNHEDPSNAEKLLIKSLEKNPYDNNVLFNLANVYLKRNKNQQAIDLFEILEYDPSFDKDYIKLKLAQAHEQAGYYDKALKAYSCFNSFESSYNSSLILRKIGNYSDALKMAKEALVHDKNNKKALYHYATLLYKNKDIEGAIHYLKQSIDFKKSNPTKMLQLGKMYLENGNYKNARKIFEVLKNSKEDEHQLEALLGLSRVDLYENNYEVSMHHAQLVLDVDPKNAIANKVMAENYLNIKQYNKAKQYYESAFNAGLEQEALIGKAIVEHKTGNVLASKLIYSQLIEEGVADFSYDTYMVMALNEHLLGNDQQSEKFIKNAIQKDNKRAEAYGYQAKFDFERMNFNSALNNYKKAIKLANNKKVYLVKLANCYVQLDKFKKAFELFDNAIKQDPTYAKAYTGKAMCLLKLGEYNEAEEVIEQAIVAAPNEPFNYMNKSYILAHAADEEVDSSERQQKLLEAVDMINKAIELDTTKMRKYYDNNMGLVYMQMNELDTAWKLIIQDTNMVTINNMGIIQELLGNESEAIGYYQSSVTADRGYMEPKNNLNRLMGKRSVYGVFNPEDANKKWRTYWIFLRNDLMELKSHQFNKIGFEPQWAEKLPSTYKYMAFKSKKVKKEKVKKHRNNNPSLYEGDNNGYSCSKL